jgi:macrolide-specific efflux system membrane fusion protein
MSKDLKPKQRLGSAGSSAIGRIVIWVVVLAAVAGGGFAAYRYNFSQPVEIPTVSVRKAEFIIAVTARGEIRSTRSTILAAPQVPNPRITKLAESGKPVKAGDVVVEFDTAQLENYYLDRNSAVRTTDSEIVQQKASHRMVNEQDAMNLMTSEYDVQRSELEASKAEILSEIEGAKNRINVGISKGALEQVKATVKSHQVSQEADISRIEYRKDKYLRDVERIKGYLGKMTIRAPIDGIVNVLPNFRAGGSWGQTPPPFKEGDNAWTGAAIAEIPDLSEMRIEIKLEEVDRGKVQVGQPVNVRVDAIPDREFTASIDWISPIAALQFRGPRTATEKNFPARATLKQNDPRLRPGMSATAQIIIESTPDALLIPARASFQKDGKPHVWVQRGQEFLPRPIVVSKRNDNDMVVVSGLNAGDRIALENPDEVRKRSRKL